MDAIAEYEAPEIHRYARSLEGYTRDLA